MKPYNYKLSSDLGGKQIYRWNVNFPSYLNNYPFRNNNSKLNTFDIK